MQSPSDGDTPLRVRALEEIAAARRTPDPTLDQITAFAREHFQVPISLVTLVQEDQVLLLSNQGLDAPQPTRNEVFCTFAIAGTEVLVIPDMLKDNRFRANPLVTGGPHIRFYAGAPLAYRGSARIGTLCVMGRRARSFSRGEQAELLLLADQVVSVLVARVLELPEPDLRTVLSI